MVSIGTGWLQMLFLLVVALLIAAYLYKLGSRRPEASLVALVAISLLIGFLYLVRGILPPFIIAVVLAWLLDPLMARLQARGVPRAAAVATILLLLVAGLVVGLRYLIPATVEQATQLARDYPDYLRSLTRFLNEQAQRHSELLSRFQLPTTAQGLFARFGEQAKGATENALSHLATGLVGLVSKVIWLLLVPLVAFYLLVDSERIRAKAVLFIPGGCRDKTLEVLGRLGEVFAGYIRGLLIVSLLYGLSTAAVLMLLDMQYGIIIGIVAGVLYAVPYVGAIATALLVFLVGLATYPHGLGQALVATGAMLVLNQIYDFLITPRILGQSVGLHPVISLFALVAGGAIWGIWGMILAVPIAASVQEIVIEFHPELARPSRASKGRKKKDGGFCKTTKGKTDKEKE